MSSRPRSIDFRPRLFLLMVVTTLAFALGACGDDDDNPVKPPDNPGLTLASTPENALALYVAAYEARDSIAVKAVYDFTYTGTSTDLDDPGNSIDLVYDDEILHVKALAVKPGLTVNLDLGPQSSWTRLPSDDPSHPEWAVITIVGFLIEIVDNADMLSAIGEPGTFQEFTFTPSLDSASPTDTLWKIVRWRETAFGGPVP